MEEDVEKFYEATKGKTGTDKLAMIRILCNSPAHHLQIVSERYLVENHMTMADGIDDEISNKFKKAALLQLNMQIDLLQTVIKQFDVADESGLTNLMVRYQPSMGKLMEKDPGLRGRIEEERKGNFQQLILKLIDHSEKSEFDQFAKEEIPNIQVARLENVIKQDEEQAKKDETELVEVKKKVENEKPVRQQQVGHVATCRMYRV